MTCAPCVCARQALYSRSMAIVWLHADLVSAAILVAGGRWMFTKLREFRERRKKIAELDVARRHEAGDFTAIHPDDDPQYQKPEYGRPHACVSVACA